MEGVARAILGRPDERTLAFTATEQGGSAWLISLGLWFCNSACGESEVRERLIAYSISCWEFTEPQSVPPHVNTRPGLAMTRGRGQY